MNFKKVFIFSLILFILSVSVVSAADLNDTHGVELSCGGDNSLAIEHSNSESADILDSEIVVNEQIQAISPGTFNDLQAEIDKAREGSVLDLYRDYNGCEDAVVHLDKDLIIDGHGHTINGKNAEGCVPFKSEKGTITLKNLIIINGRNDGYFFNYNGGAITITGSARYTIDNCTFRNNYADDYGGAIYNGVHNPLIVINCVFDSNTADDDHGGAIYSNGDLYVGNCSFIHNKAEKGGAIYAYEDTKIIIINSGFVDNSAEYYGGAVFANPVIDHTSVGLFGIPKDDIYDLLSSINGACIINSKFKDNSAGRDGGAVYSEKGVYVKNSTFESNRAEGSIIRDGGGAILVKKDVEIDNCTFKNNYAGNCGGAIYANTVTFDGTPSYFISNTADKGKGGAIYTNKFTNDVSHVTFSANSAGEGATTSDDGGAIYINEENHITFSKCTFINNHCSDEGGAIYLDSTSSDLALIDNTFIGNSAGHEGQAVFNKGSYKSIRGNYWGGKNPSTSNDILIEWVFIGSNKHHVDSSPAAGLVSCMGSFAAIDNPVSLSDTVILANSNPGTFEDLQAEIDKAREGSVLDLYRDYNGCEDAVVHLDKDLTIDGHDHTINGKNAQGCIPFKSEKGTITLKNLIIINGRNDGYFFNYNGGAITITGSARYTIDNCMFINNYADDYGGAIYNGAENPLRVINSYFDSNIVDDEKGGAIYSKGALYVEHCGFINNKAENGGGAIYCEGEVVANYCWFELNNVTDDNGVMFVSGNGGAIWSLSDVKITGCTFRMNHAVGYGGAVYANDATINECTFEYNWANDSGGAIYSYTITLAKSNWFEYNTAYKGKGGAIYTDKFENDVSNARFSFNHAGKGAKISDDGGAIYINKENHVTFTQCEFIDNSCTDEGGAIYLDSTGSELSLINNTFGWNTADDEGQAVFNKGTYKKIEGNYWEDKKPSENNDILVEWKWIGHNKHHVDSNPRT